MLSILIPSYNFDIRIFVQKLHTQGQKLSIPFEILIVEDASKKDFVQKNQILQELENVSYEVLINNLGRSKIRNYLANKARYEYLLFMDCDSMPISEHFLSNYVQDLQANSLIYGGRCYSALPSSDPALFFHWHYGKNREESSAETRQKKPYQSFMTNNFLVPKTIFEQIKFDESLTQYGHEDTLFGLELQKRNIPIIHIDNPLEHIGLEENNIFIRKSEQAIQNLVLLQSKFDLKQDVKLLRYYFRLKQYFLLPLVHLLYKISKPLLLNNLQSKHPKLLLFDFYKLGYLISTQS